MPLNQPEVHLRDYLKVISKRRTLVWSVFLVVFAVVALVTFASTPLYQGTTKVLIEKAANNGLTDNSPSRIYDPEFYETQFQLIKSRAVARRVVKALDLVGRFDSVAGGRKSWLSGFKGMVKSLLGHGADLQQDAGETDREIAIADRLDEDLEVRPFKNSRIVTINYLSPNPQFAAKVANQTAKAYIEETLEMKLDSTRLTLGWMSKKAEEEAHKLEGAEKALQKYMVDNDIVTMQDRLAVGPQQLNELSTELVKAESHRKELETLNQKVSKVAGNPEEAETIPAIADDVALQTLRSQILKAEQSIRELSNKFGPKHPVMKKAVGDLEVLKNKRDMEIARVIASIRNEYDLAKSKVDNLRSQVEKTKAEALNLNQKFIQYGALKREVDTNRQLYDALMLKLKEQSITEETQPVNLWIVEQASVPDAPVKPNKKKNLLLGVIVGLMAGIGLAFFVEYLDNTVKYPEETEQALGLPVLGLVSMWTDKQKAIEKVMLEAPRSAFSESYRALRTAVLLSSAEGAPGKIMVTSPGEAAGKSTTAINLAIALAQSDQKVLLIDADLRKPRLHKLFQKPNQNGLSNYLAGGNGESLLQKGPLDNLAVITSGPIPPNPSELLSSTRMDDLLGKLQNQFDVIICDTPPLMSVADARVLARKFDGTILVLRAHKTTFDLAGKALKSLHDINAPILGMVINALEMKKSDAYYNYYYSSYGEEPETAGDR